MVNYYAFLSDYKRQIHDLECLNQDLKDVEQQYSDDYSPLEYGGRGESNGEPTPINTKENSPNNLGVPHTAELDSESQLGLIRSKNPSLLLQHTRTQS